METDPSTLGPDAPDGSGSTAASSQPRATQTTRRTIHDYFASSPSITRRSSVSEANSTTEESSTSSQSNDASNDPSAKKFKITANNGHAIMIRQPGIQKKRVKKEEALYGSLVEDVGRVSYSRRHHARGKLRIFPSLPLDVVFEIFGHLLPIDLLQLTRATKDIRALLLHRSASYVWKSALANVPDLPLCPQDVSPPRWASLAFDTFCQNCLASNVRSVNFDLRVRYCNKCVKLKLLAIFSFDAKTNPRDALILQGVPFSRWNERVDLYCTIADKNKFLEEYSARRGDAILFMKEKIEELKVRREHSRKCKAWYNALLGRRLAELDEIRDTRAELISKKLITAGFSEELDFLTLFSEGTCAILPWPIHIVHFEDHPHVKVAKPLTEKAWDKIKDDMFDYMREVSVELKKDTRFRIEQKRRVAFHTAYVNWRCLPHNLRKYPPDMLMPGAADILASARVKRMVEKPGVAEYDPSIAMTFLEEDFELNEFIVLWREQNINSLYQDADYIAPFQRRFSHSWPVRNDFFAPPSYTIKEDMLKSAVFVFRCEQSGSHWEYLLTRLDEEGHDHHEAQCMWYPEFFFHPCTSMCHSDWEERRTMHNRSLSLEKQFRFMRRDPWDADRLKFDDKASKTVKKLLDAAGLDLKTTVEELDELDHRFVCLKCTFGARCDGSRKVRVWSWRDAVQHCLKTHFGDSRVTWECLHPEDREEALALQAIEHTKRGYLAPGACKIWKCMRCRDTSSESRRMSMVELRAHFVERPKHGKVEDIDEGEGVLYYKARDYSPKELAPVKMIPEAHDTRPLTLSERTFMKFLFDT